MLPSVPAMPAPTKSAGPRKRLSICCLATAIFVLLLAAVLVIIYFTVLKPKHPQVKATLVGVRHIDFQPFPNVALNLSLDVDVTIKNPNYAGFQYASGKTVISYHGTPVGESPVAAGKVGARSSETVATWADLEAAKMITNQNFVMEAILGELPLTSATSVEGKVAILGMFKLHASALINCDITVNLFVSSASSNCRSEVSI